MLEVDFTGAVLFHNPSAIRELERWGAAPDARLFLPDDIHAIIAALEQRQITLARREVVIGSAIFAESIYLATGFGTIRIFATDMTERKRREEALRQYNAELQNRNVELEAFAHTVAHDIKNPLHLISGFADMLAENDAALPPAEVVTSLQFIVRSGKKLNSITDNLRLLSQVRQKDISRAPLDMEAIVADARLRVANLLDDQTEIVMPETWPIGLGYEPWVEEIWVNYLSNALKYAGRPVRIELGGELQPDGMVRYWTSDNGQGVALSHQVHLFEAFYREDAARHGGYGLGLSIVKRSVERLGGKVEVQSSGAPGEAVSSASLCRRRDLA